MGHTYLLHTHTDAFLTEISFSIDHLMKVRVSEYRMDLCVMIKMLSFCHVFYLQERREYLTFE